MLRRAKLGHKDPFDRMLIWQCLQHDWILVSCDELVALLALLVVALSSGAVTSCRFALSRSVKSDPLVSPVLPGSVPCPAGRLGAPIAPTSPEPTALVSKPSRAPRSATEAALPSLIAASAAGRKAVIRCAAYCPETEPVGGLSVQNDT